MEYYYTEDGEPVVFEHYNTRGVPLITSQVRCLRNIHGAEVCTGSLEACQLAAERRGWVVGVDCIIANIWSL
jgi:hypothetical protein